MYRWGGTRAGEAEYWYALIILGLCIPVFVHLLLDYFFDNISHARESFAAWKVIAKKEIAYQCLETRRMLRR
jgi:hypothetical protein